MVDFIIVWAPCVFIHLKFVGSYCAAEASLELTIPSTEIIGCCWIANVSASISYPVGGFLLLRASVGERTLRPIWRVKCCSERPKRILVPDSTRSSESIGYFC